MENKTEQFLDNSIATFKEEINHVKNTIKQYKDAYEKGATHSLTNIKGIDLYLKELESTWLKLKNIKLNLENQKEKDNEN